MYSLTITEKHQMITARVIVEVSLRALKSQEVSSQVPISSSSNDGKNSTVVPDKPTIVLLPNCKSAESIWVLFLIYMCNRFPNQIVKA